MWSVDDRAMLKLGSVAPGPTQCLRDKQDWDPGSEYVDQEQGIFSQQYFIELNCLNLQKLGSQSECQSECQSESTYPWVQKSPDLG